MKYIHADCDFCGKPVVRSVQAKSANVKRHFCNMECKSNFQRLAKPVSREWLYEQYVTRGRDTSDIAREVKRDPKSVWNWLKDLNIPTRPRGSYSQWRPKGREPGFNLSDDAKEKIKRKCIERGSRPYMKNGQHWLKTAPKEKHPKWLGGITPERQQFYASPEWQSVARKVWKRDNRSCQRCGKKHDQGIPFDIHHIVSFQYKPLRCELTNLVLLCEVCHYWVHGPENMKGEFLKPCP